MSKALVETGEHLSPKYAPEMIAPPIIAGLILRASATVMHIVPIVADVPNAVPVRNETKQLSKNESTTKKLGCIIFTEWQTMAGIVPEARQRAVIRPISKKLIRIFRTEATPSADIFKISLMPKPFFNA